MTPQEFDVIVTKRIENIKKVLASKGQEYGSADRLYNIKRAYAIERSTPQKALCGMLLKHLGSVLDLVEGKLEATEAMVNEKVGDMINYLILLEAIFEEQREIERHHCYVTNQTKI